MMSKNSMMMMMKKVRARKRGKMPKHSMSPSGATSSPIST